MPNEIAAGESSPPTAAPSHVVDAHALAESIVGQVFARMPVQDAPTAASREDHVSALKAKADELLASQKIDKDVAPALMELMEAMGNDLSAKQRKVYEQAANEQSTRAIHSELGRMIDRLAQACPNPELIRELKPSILAKTIDDYNAVPSLVAAYNRTKEVNWTEMEKFLGGHVKKWATTTGGAKEDKPAGGPAMKNSAPSGTAEVSHEVSIDSLDEKQREIFNSQVSFGKKQMNLEPEAAKKRALDLISKAESKMKSKR